MARVRGDIILRHRVSRTALWRRPAVQKRSIPEELDMLLKNWTCLMSFGIVISAKNNRW